MSPEVVTQKIYQPISERRILLTWIAVLCLYGAVILVQRCYRKKGLEAALEDIRLDTEPMLTRYGFWIFIGVALLALLLQLNNSSMRCYDMVLPNAVASSDMISFGTPRSIRSDEFLVNLSSSFHQWSSDRPTVVSLSYGTLVGLLSGILTLINPLNWGNLFFPASLALSWNFVFGLALTLYFFYRLFYILTKHRVFAVVAAFLFAYAPGIQWWGGPTKYGVLCGIVVLFYEFFNTDKKPLKVLCCWGLVCLMANLVASVYPAWDVALIYMFLLVLVGIYVTKKKFTCRKSDFIYVGITVALMAFVIIMYFVGQQEITSAMLETAYPGKRFSAGGGLPSSYWVYHLAAPLMPWKGLTLSGTNASEASMFLHMFPIPLVLFLVRYKEFKRHKAMLFLFIFNLVCILYMVFGIGTLLAAVTLLSYSVPQRIMTIFGCGSFLLLLLECYYIVPIGKGRGKDAPLWIRCGILNASICAFLLWVGLTQPELVSYLTTTGFALTCAGMLLFGNLLFVGKKRVAVLLLCGLTIVSGVPVHPINMGAGVMTDTALAIEIRSVDQADTGRWLALGNHILPKYVNAQGVDCINALSWPPRFDLFDLVDEAGIYRDIYNRYAHMTVNLTQEETTFALIQPDWISIELNVDALRLWDVKYIVQKGAPPSEMGSVQFERVYFDALDNTNIYRVIYAPQPQ